MPGRTPFLPPHRFHMLMALAEGDRHGVGIMQSVLRETGGRIRLWPAMLYRNLEQLVEDGLIAEVDGRGTALAGSPRFYHLTAAGRRLCAAEARRLAGIVQLARSRRLLGKDAER